MSRPPNAQLTHIGFLVRDVDAMISFYTRVIGLALTDRGPYRAGGEIIFMSRSPEEHHQVVFVTGRSDSSHVSILNQISFHVDTLEDLRTFYATLVAEKVRDLAPRNHGNAWSIYFLDPDGNRVELYTPSPWYVAQPFGQDLDMTEPVATIMAKTEAMIRDNPTLSSRDDWAGRLASTLVSTLKVD